MNTRRDIINTLFEKNAKLEKRAFITHLLKPVNTSLKGKALVDRIAPLGLKRILAETGHGLGNVTLGGLAGLGLAGAVNPAELKSLLQGGAMSNDMLMSTYLGGASTAGIGKLLDQSRTNKYLNMALKKGPNQLGRSDLKSLLNEMGTFANMRGSENAVEFFQGQSARRKVQDALDRMEYKG